MRKLLSLVVVLFTVSIYAQKTPQPGIGSNLGEPCADDSPNCGFWVPPGEEGGGDGTGSGPTCWLNCRLTLSPFSNSQDHATCDDTRGADAVGGVTGPTPSGRYYYHGFRGCTAYNVGPGNSGPSGCVFSGDTCYRWSQGPAFQYRPEDPSSATPALLSRGGPAMEPDGPHFRPMANLMYLSTERPDGPAYMTEGQRDDWTAGLEARLQAQAEADGQAWIANEPRWDVEREAAVRALFWELTGKPLAEGAFMVLPYKADGAGR